MNLNFVSRMFSLCGILLCLLQPGCKSIDSSPSQSNVKWKLYNPSNSAIQRNHIYTIYTDYGNNVWVGTDSGVYVYKNQYWSAYIDSIGYVVGEDGNGKSIVAATVTSIAQSVDGSMWFGQQMGGILRYKPSSTYRIWRRYSAPPLPSQTISSIGAESRQGGELWVGTYTGVGRFTQHDLTGPEDPLLESWSIITTSNSRLASNLVTSVAACPYDNVIWFGTSNAGLTTYNAANLGWANYRLSNNADPGINSIAFEINNKAWFATSHGVYSMNMSTHVAQFYDYKSTGGILPKARYTSAAASDGYTRWFGSDSGLVCLKDTTWSRLTTRNSSLPNDQITTLSLDRKGNLWIGTLYGGLVEYNENGIEE